MAPPTCSIVLPVYGRTATWERALRSALDQTLTDIEVIVVDDASPTPVRLPSEMRADARVRLIRREKNGGVAAAQNTGAAAANGEFLGFLHSDDEWYPDRLGRQTDVLEHSAAMAVESATLRRHLGGDQVVGARLASVGHDSLLRREVRNLHISGLLFRTEALSAIGGFDESLRSYEDFDLLVRFIERFEIGCTSDVVAIVNQAGDDRLGHSPWMAKARRLLIDKYEDELRERYGEFPPVWKDWAMADALDLVDEHRFQEARTRIAQSVGGQRLRAVHRAPLFVGTYCGTRLASSVAALYRRRIERPKRG